MYFTSRIEAGKLLASELVDKYRNTKTTIIALSDGGVVVGMQIASALGCPITMLLTEALEVPGELSPLAIIDQDGDTTYNHVYSSGELEDFDMEYHHYVEQMKLEKLQKLHRLVGKKGLITKDLLRDRNVILVSDGLNSGFYLDAAVEYLKSIEIKRLIAVTPFASVAAVDRMHILADEIHCLNVVDNYISTDHYYEDNRLPDHEAIVSTVDSIVEGWH